ncbi:Clp protease N-terminal domain-containing protein [Streptomyces sp. CBMA123]|uniref:Clp protease N-terminal domain-containing protein n=1 Tax=Streptomyces sp. CBMA123 TaxID=1896313 RepID=UPI0029500461|nr:Clp protease N-terminal domain-containing protein [Streptomyces sp. CBMA123]
MVLAGHRGLPRGDQAGGAQEARTAGARQGRGRRLNDVRAVRRRGAAGGGRRAAGGEGLRHGHVGTEHLLLAILAGPEDPAAGVLIGMGLDHEAAHREVVRLLGPGDDAEALASIGVDLEAVRGAVESAFGEGALDVPAEEAPERRGWFRSGESKPGRSPFSPGAKKALELSLRESLRLKSREIAVGHLLLGVLREGEGLGVRVVADHGLDVRAVRQAVEAELG